MASWLKWTDLFEESLTPLFVTEQGRRAGLAMVIGMSGLLLYGFISMIMSLRSDYRIAHSTPPVSVLNDHSENAAQWIAKIPEAHLFGKAGVQASGLPITSLQLRLVGVIKASPEKFSRVIISEGDQPGKVYQMGDTLSSGVRVHAITEAGVVLDNGGTYENLPLERAALEFQDAPKPLLKPLEGDQ